MLADKLIQKDEIIEEPRLVTRKETFTRMFTFDRSFTFDRTFTYDRRLSSGVSGVGFDSEEVWTKKLIDGYTKVAVQGNEGDIPIPLAFAQTKRFWELMIFSGLIGGLIALFAILFMNFAYEVPKLWIDNDDFSTLESCQKYAGKKYWILITFGTGVLVGVIRWVSAYPDDRPGVFKEVNDCHVDPKHVPLTVLISLISLCGGASLGPEQALSNLGGGVATYLMDRSPFEEDDKKLAILSGMTAALGALFPSPMLGPLLVYELGNPPKDYMESMIVLSFSGIVSYIIYYTLSDNTYLERISQSYQHYIVAVKWEFDEWQLGTGFCIGIVAGVVSVLMILVIGINKQVFYRIRSRLRKRNSFVGSVVPPALAGLVIGCVNQALPLTVGSGDSALYSLIKFGFQNQLSTSLLLQSIIAKIFVLGASMNSGFVGGFVFPQITIGLMCGIVTYNIFSSFMPFGLAVGCWLPAISSGICPMPITLTLLSLFIFNFGLYQTAPIFVSTITAYTLVCGSGLFGALVSRAKNAQTQAEADIISPTTTRQSEYKSEANILYGSP